VLRGVAVGAVGFGRDAHGLGLHTEGDDLTLDNSAPPACGQIKPKEDAVVCA
jgi:hypothetical protein